MSAHPCPLPCPPPYPPRQAIILWTTVLDAAGVTNLGDASGSPYRWSISRSPESWKGPGFPISYAFTVANAGQLPVVGTNSLKDAILTSEASPAHPPLLQMMMITIMITDSYNTIIQ